MSIRPPLAANPPQVTEPSALILDPLAAYFTVARAFFNLQGTPTPGALQKVFKPQELQEKQFVSI